MAAFADASVSRLLLIRHGAAAAEAPGGDRERPLTLEGRQAVAALAARLRPFGAPDAIFCSPARRTVETWEILAGALAPAPTPDCSDWLYLADHSLLLHHLRALEATLGRVL